MSIHAFGCTLGSHTVPDAPDPRHRAAAPEQIPAVPDEGARRFVRDDKRRALTSGCHAPRHRQQQRGQVYHRSGSPGHRRPRNRCRAAPRDRLQPATRSAARAAGCDRPAASRSQQKLAARLRARERWVPIPARVPGHAARCCTLIGKPVSLVGSIYAAGCGMSPATHRPRAGAPGNAIRGTARERSGWHVSARFVRRYTHAGGSTGEIGPLRPFWARSFMRQARRGTRALIVCAATC